MEQRNLLVAIALSFLVFFLWNVLFSPKPETDKKDAVGAGEETAMAPVRKNSSESTAEAPPIIPQAQPMRTSQAARNLKIDTPLYTMTVTEQGAAVKSMVLKKYREKVDEDSQAKEILPQDLPGGTVLLSSSGSLGKSLETAFFQHDQTTDALEVFSQPLQVSFRTILENGIQVEKAFTFTPDSYLVNLDVTLYNGSDQVITDQMGLVLQQIVNPSSGYGFEGPSGLINNSLEQVSVKDISDKDTIEGKIKWVAIETHYFMSSLIAGEPSDAKMIMAQAGKVVRNQLVFNTGELMPKQNKTLSADLYIGPKSLEELKKLNDGLDRAIDFGWFDFIAKPCLWFMNFLYGIIPNYGVAIIILTIITRLIFWPLAAKSYKSMGEMRKIQPLMQEIREKHKNDKTKMNQEMMALYRTYKINPMGGCLPMLIQLPVFFALYRMLYQAIELRHAPFIWWIDDLSAPDRLFQFGFAIPFMDPPYGIPVLTLVMGATMFLQQKMTPSPGDPTQAKMMMLMPIVFTFIFINFSSGLVLYWMVSNILSIAQQYYTQKKTA